MYGFPDTLYSQPAQLFDNMNNSGFQDFSQQNGIFFSRKSGNWNDPSVWETTGTTTKLPTKNSIVYIRHNVLANITTTCYHLFISGTLSFATAVSVSVNGNIQATGTIDMTSANNSNLVLYGVNNSIVTFVSGASGTVTYARAGDQNIMDLSYRNVTVIGSIGTKYAIADLNIHGNLWLQNGAVELSSYNLTVSGTTTVGQAKGTLSKTGSGAVLFIGQLTFRDASIISFTGNPNVEFRGGIALYTATLPNFGNGSISFTTNNQSITSLLGSQSCQFAVMPIISGAITLTIGANVTLILYNSINGNNSSSKLINSGTISLRDTTLPMTVGIFDYLTTPNTIEYNFDTNYILPYTAYYSLSTKGGGLKSLLGNTTLLGNLTTGANGAPSGNISFSSYNLTVNGSTQFDSNVIESGSGNSYLFIGNVYFHTGNIDFSYGNPTIEFRGGVTFYGTTWVLGTGTKKFATNNQVFSTPFGTTLYNIDGPILISGAISLTNNIATSPYGMVSTGSIDGDNSMSTFINKGRVQYQSPTQPMTTGVLDCSTITNNFIYNLSGNQDIKGGTYQNLTIGGSGVKTLQGNIVVLGTYTVTGTASLNLNGYTKT